MKPEYCSIPQTHSYDTIMKPKNKLIYQYCYHTIQTRYYMSIQKVYDEIALVAVYVSCKIKLR